MAAAQLWLVARAGTDIPFYDQWNIEGRWLYPGWNEGSIHVGDLLKPVNEHRIFWTHLLNLLLFKLDGQWDPLVQLAIGTGLRASCAGGLCWALCHGLSWRGGLAVATGVAFAFLPHLAWHTVLWGFQSCGLFVLGFSILSMALLGAADCSPARILGGLAAGFSALLAMGPGGLVPVALLGLVGVRAAESRRLDRTIWAQTWPALILLVAALALRAKVPEHAQVAAGSPSQFLISAGRILAWPHVGQPLAMLAINLPLLTIVAGRLAGRRRAVRTEDFVLLIGGWSLGVGLATAWMRGGSPELLAGVPSRYVDFIVLLPLANAWCAVQLAREATRRRIAITAVLAWSLFLLVGWAGLSVEVWRGVIGPRSRDRAAPERLAREFQLSRDPGVFAGQPRLLIPHPNLGVVSAVLDDPRMKGVLPPTLQPRQPQGPLSRAVRWLFGR